jgi:hypothetical protein
MVLRNSKRALRENRMRIKKARLEDKKQQNLRTCMEIHVSHPAASSAGLQYREDHSQSVTV